MAFAIGTEALGVGKGTGTESDPWIIDDTNNTCQNFIDAVATENAYIDMQADVDFSIDPTYRNGMSTYLTISCNKLYASTTKTDGTKYGVNGLKITSNYFMVGNKSVAEYAYIENVSFVNCIFNKIDANSYFFGAVFYTTSPIFTNCDFSFIMNCYSFNKGISPNGDFQNTQMTIMDFNDCSFYMIITGDASGGYDGTNKAFVPIFHYAGKMTRCCIEIGSLSYNGYTEGYQAYGGFCNLYGCTILGTINFFPLVSGQTTSHPNVGILFNYCSNCCIAITFPKCPRNNVDAFLIRNFIFNNMSNVSIVDTDIMETDASIVKPTQSVYVYPLTTQQMKDENYLMSIGFLP
jgi:hypothetical protein